MDEQMHKFQEESRRVFDRHDKQKKFQILLHGRIMKRSEGEPGPVLFSYRQLRDYLDKMPADALSQQVEILPPQGGSISDIIMLEPVIGVGTVEEMLHVDGEVVTETRSSQDFAHHPERIILLTDYNGHSKDGDTYYTMTDGGFIGNKTGKEKPWIDRGRCEPTMKASQTSGFLKLLPESDEELMQMQEDICMKGDAATTEELSQLNHIQAELYRRIYRLTPREKLAKAAKIELSEGEEEQ